MQNLWENIKSAYYKHVEEVQTAALIVQRFV